MKKPKLLIQYTNDDNWYTYDGKIATDQQIKEYIEWEQREKTGFKNAQRYKKYLKRQAVKSRYIAGIERAFWGTGGHIFMRNYLDTLFSDVADEDWNQYLEKLCLGMQEDLRSDYQDSISYLTDDEKKSYSDLFDINPISLEDQKLFLTKYFEIHTREARPELCGELVAVLINMCEKTFANKKILGLDELGPDEYLYWDS